MGSIINLEMSGQTFERKAVLLCLNINDKRKFYTIEFEEQFILNGEIVSRERHMITEDGETWDRWDQTIGAQIRPLLEADIKRYFETDEVVEEEEIPPVSEEPPEPIDEP